MATIDNTGRPGYMYDEDTDTWYAISGKVSTSANYVWSGANTFNNNVFANGTLTATLRFNSFLNPAARSSAITAPAVGLLTFIQQDAGGNTVNKFQYWNGSAWTDLAAVAFQSSAPVSPQTGNIWINSLTLDMFVYNGTAWVQTGGSGGATSSFFLGGM